MTQRLSQLEEGVAQQGFSGQQGNTRRPSRNQTPTVICYRCGKEGHYARGCALRRPSRQGNSDMANNIVDLFAINPHAAFHINGVINSYTVHFMVDTGVAVSLLGTDM